MCVCVESFLCSSVILMKCPQAAIYNNRLERAVNRKAIAAKVLSITVCAFVAYKHTYTQPDCGKNNTYVALAKAFQLSQLICVINIFCIKFSCAT